MIIRILTRGFAVALGTIIALSLAQLIAEAIADAIDVGAW